MITKYFKLELPLGISVYKRFPFHNPDDSEKTLKLSSSVPKVLKIRTPVLKILPKEVEYIRVCFKIEYLTEVLLFITHLATDMVEETLSFKLIPSIPSDQIEVLESRPN